MSVLLIAVFAACAWVSVVVAVLAICVMAARGDAACELPASWAEAQAPPKLSLSMWEPTPQPERITASRRRHPQRGGVPAH
jgi:hypothetical protein